MTEEDAFLRAITEEPDDDTPRMVYADWLTDRGDPRGEFIRAQCRLAQMADDDPARPALEAAEQELLDRHGDEWLGPLRPLLCGWVFRRGFLDEVTLPAEEHLHPARPLPATVRWVEVDLAGFEPDADVIEYVPESVAREHHPPARLARPDAGDRRARRG